VITPLVTSTSTGMNNTVEGKQFDEEGNGFLVGVAIVQPTGDPLIDLILSLPVRCGHPDAGASINQLHGLAANPTRALPGREHDAHAVASQQQQKQPVAPAEPTSGRQRGTACSGGRAHYSCARAGGSIVNPAVLTETAWRSRQHADTDMLCDTMSDDNENETRNVKLYTYILRLQYRPILATTISS
jgi:hypothetical protein